MTEPIDETRPATEAADANGLWLLVTVVVGIVAVVFFFWLAIQNSRGEILFGTGGSDCEVTGKAATFPASATIHFAVHLEREADAGASVDVVLTHPDGTTDATDFTSETSWSCDSDVVTGPLAPGHYLLEYRSAAEVLASGTFDITP